jgi:hypothetical protein
MWVLFDPYSYFLLVCVFVAFLMITQELELAIVSKKLPFFFSQQERFSTCSIDMICIFF